MSVICKACYGTSSSCKACEGRGVVKPDVMTLGAVRALIDEASARHESTLQDLIKTIATLRYDVDTMRRAQAQAVEPRSDARPPPTVRTGTNPADLASNNGAIPGLRVREGLMADWQAHASDGSSFMRRYACTYTPGAIVAMYRGNWEVGLHLNDGVFQYGPFSSAQVARDNADFVLRETGYLTPL